MELEKNIGSKVSIAYTILRDKILNGAFEYGEVLSSNELSSELQMSRTPILEAFKLLERKDMVKVIPQIGVIVKPLNLDDLRQRYKALAVLEGYLAGEAAKNCTESDADRLLELIDENDLCIEADDNNRVLELNNRLHETIHEMGNNSYVQDLCKQLGKRHNCKWKDILYNKENNVQYSKEHKACFKAIKEQDVLKARSLMENHVLRTRKQFLEIMAAQEKSLPI